MMGSVALPSRLALVLMIIGRRTILAIPAQLFATGAALHDEHGVDSGTEGTARRSLAGVLGNLKIRQILFGMVALGLPSVSQVRCKS